MSTTAQAEMQKATGMKAKKMDQQMKEESGSNVQKEETKNLGGEQGVSPTGASGLEGGIMPRMDLWKDFDDWHKSIFEDFSRIDQEMDRRFREF